ncbi:MAG: hypothetical protein ACLFN8_05015 [Candidatus Woesearchaeota archaeon]
MKLLNNLFVFTLAVVLFSSFSLAVVSSEDNSEVRVFDNGVVADVFNPPPSNDDDVDYEGGDFVDSGDARGQIINERVKVVAGNGRIISPDVETLPFATNNGARVRMLQLERSIHVNILKGRVILDRLSDSFSDEDLVNLFVSLENLVDLKDQVSSYEFVGGEEDVRNFVFFRQEASNLSKEFRDGVRLLLDENDATVLKRELNNRVNVSEVRAEYNPHLDRFVRGHNEEVLRRASGVVSDDLIERIRTGNLTARAIKFEVLANVKSRSADNTSDTLTYLKEQAMREQIRIREERAKLKEELKARHAEEVEERLLQARTRVEERIPEDIKSRINERISNMSASGTFER